MYKFHISSRKIEIKIRNVGRNEQNFRPSIKRDKKKIRHYKAGVAKLFLDTYAAVNKSMKHILIPIT